MDQSKTMCVIPWVHTYINTRGKASLCCDASGNDMVDIYGKKSMHDVINAPIFRQIRLSIMNGESVSVCNNCYAIEKFNILSHRQIANQQYPEIISNLRNITDDDGKIDVNLRKTMNFTYTNVCNFKCRMCTGDNSSILEKEEIMIYGENYKEKYSSLHDKRDNSEYKQIFSTITTMLDKIEYIEFSGGEPILIGDHYKILDYFINHNQDIHIAYNTNISVLKYKNISFIDYLMLFKKVTLRVSLDACGARHEYIRNGAIWKTIMNNIMHVRDKAPHVKIEIRTVVSIYNIFDVFNLYEYLITENIVASCDARIMPIFYPEYLSLQVLPYLYKIRISQLINNHMYFLKNNNGEHLIDNWRGIRSFMMDEYKSQLLSLFFDHVDKLDEVRNERFDETFPEYADLISYV